MNPRPPGYLSEAPPLKAPLRCPKNASGLRSPSHFSTAAEPPLCLSPPPAAHRGAFPTSTLVGLITRNRNTDRPMKNLSPPYGELRFLVAGEGFEPTTSGYLSEAPPLKAPLRCPKNASGLRSPSHFSTAAEPPLCLSPPPAAQRSAFPTSTLVGLITRSKDAVSSL